MRANEVITILKTAGSRHEIDTRLKELARQGVITTASWTENLATIILQALVVVLDKGRELSKPVKEAYGRAYTAAMKWKEENPEFAAILQKVAETVAEGLLIIIAMAILAEMMPWVIEALGFGMLGPRLGSWAARWQSLYGGATPGGSFFAFLQRMGMKWTTKAML